ncbi:MAG: hypothetical protein J0L75_01840 [Spirochaetes bacterium]|nr:hypothetical protein [Spirochaetota bacterium]
MKQALLATTLGTALLALVSCPASNGHAPFDVLNGDISLNQALADNSAVKIVTLDSLSSSYSSASRTGTLSVSVSIQNGSSSSYTFKTTDTVEFFYTGESNLQALYQTNSTAGSLGKYTFFSYSSGTSISGGSTGTVSIPVNMTTNMVVTKRYYIGAYARINSKDSKIATNDLYKLVKVTAN